MSGHRLLFAATAAGSLLAAAVVLWRAAPVTSPVPGAPAVSTEQTEPLPTPVTAAPAPAEQTEQADPSGLLLLPDGTRVATLNGATNPAPLADAWPAGVPWSPIVGTERSDLGVDWYVHADGTRSTTEMKWRSDLGRLDALTRVARPGPAAPPVKADR